MPAAQAQENPLPPDLHLWAGSVVRFCAIDPTTGLEVPNVTVTNAILTVTNMGGGAAEDLQSGPFMLVPGPGATV